MKKLEDLLSYGREELQKADIPSAMADARILLQHILKVPRETILLEPERCISKEEAEKYKILIGRRQKYEPVAKIIGTRSFWKSEFFVTKDTLDPRPDSETLIEMILDACPKREERYNILDLGTGTGCLLLSLLQEYILAEGVGVDISEDALTVAKRNGEKLTLDNRVSWVKSNWLDCIGGQYDIIISNPPYIPSKDREMLMLDVVDYDPHQALFAGVDGLESYRNIIPPAIGKLKEDGILVMELGIGQAEAVASIARSCGFGRMEFRKDLSAIDRAILLGK